MNRIKRIQGWDVLIVVLLFLMSILWLVPFYFMLRNSLALDREITAMDWVWWPKTMQWGNFKELFADPFVPMAHGFLVSAIITIVTVVFQIGFALMAGYATARIPYRWATLVFILIIGTMMIPSDALFVQTFALIAKFGWLNTYQGLFAPALFSAFNTFMFRQYFLDFPKELEDAGTVDGLDWFGSFRHLAVPNSWGIIIALASLTMVSSWNSFLWPLVIGQGRNWWTVQVNLSVFMTAQVIRLHEIFAAALLGALPMLILFFFLQRWIALGVARSGIKG
jgi:multiple sugar transport system permease protein